MSVAFAAPRQRGKGEITPATIQKMLDENNHLIQCIMEYQNKGKTSECSQYQQMWEGGSCLGMHVRIKNFKF
uniref:SS18 N-terminal domain-containing protein n=1 Tax=Capra hircus TaxID=9925 RepID=A0A452G416_CAPHI